MKLFNAVQIRSLDQYTVEQEPVASVDLMERAADALCAVLVTEYPSTTTSFYCVAGPGNNGGDTLALARKLCEKGYPVKAYLLYTNSCSSDTALRPSSLSPDCAVNRQRLIDRFPDVLAEEMTDDPGLPIPAADAVVIDGLFGSGLNRPLKGAFARVVQFINKLPNPVIAIDVPSGLQPDACLKLTESAVKATLTLTFQFPKPAFFFPENEDCVGRWQVLDIRLHPEGIAQMPSSTFYSEAHEMSLLLKKRSRFAHKGTCGHLAIIAGSKGMAGASILASRAALRTGVGLLTLHGPECNRCIVQSAVPELMFETDQSQDAVSGFHHSDRYSAIAIGCGLGTRTATVEMMESFLNHLNKPCVLDADALNILASTPALLAKIPAGSIITPHPGEFVRLFGTADDSCQLLEKAVQAARHYNITVVLKGAYTKVVAADESVYYNSTGNPGMATAGSGDVLTGIIGSLLAQGYDSLTAARLGVYLHGLSADLSLASESEESLLAGDIISGLGQAFHVLRSQS